MIIDVSEAVRLERLKETIVCSLDHVRRIFVKSNVGTVYVKIR